MAAVDGDEKRCPKCGKTAKFSSRARVPGTGVGFTGAGGALPEPQYTRAWACEDILSCDYFESESH